MELHPIVEKLSELRPNLWCVLSPSGDGPSPRVGHTCLFLGGKNDSDLQGNKNPRILIIGGGNPDGSFNDVYSIDIGIISCYLLLSAFIYVYRIGYPYIFLLCILFGGEGRTDVYPSLYDMMVSKFTNYITYFNDHCGYLMLSFVRK